MDKNTHFSTFRCSLDFNPVQKWHDELPALCWGKWLLTSWHKGEGPVLDVQQQTDKSFVEAFHTCHPRLSLSELARIYRSWESLSSFKAEVDINWTSFFKLYQIEDSPALRSCLLKIANSPLSFQNWMSQHLVSYPEISFLNDIQDQTFLNLITERIVQLASDRGQGLTALLWSCELYFMGHVVQNILNLESHSIKYWLKYLYEQKHLDQADDSQLPPATSQEKKQETEAPSKESFIERTRKLTEN